MANKDEILSRLKGEVLPALFADPKRIGEYGATSSGAEALNTYSNLMEGGSVTTLAESIREIVAKLAEADPREIAKKATWLDRIMGHEVERVVRYQVARASLDSLLSHANEVAERVRQLLVAIDEMIRNHAHESEMLRLSIQAGQDFLNENPDAGIAQPGAVEFDRPRERFARKLTNLATLLSSHDMSVMQMKLTHAQALDMLDRFDETATMLVPVWRQHTLALITTKHMSPAMVAEATKAHQNLMRSLSQSLEGIEQ